MRQGQYAIAWGRPSGEMGRRQGKGALKVVTQ